MTEPITANPTPCDAEPVVSEAKLRVRYAETDQMNVVYHSNYIVWFEVGRVEFMRQLGFTYKEMEQQDQTHLPVVEVRCRYKAPARYDDEIVVRTHVARLRTGFVQFAYEVRRIEDDLLLAEGESTHVVVNGKMERTSLPDKYVKVLRMALGKSAS